MGCTDCSRSTSFPQTRDCIDRERHFSGSCPLQSKVRKRETERKKYSIPSLEYIHEKWAETSATMFGMSLTASSEYKVSLATFHIFFWRSKHLHNSVIPLRGKDFENLSLIYNSSLPFKQLHISTLQNSFYLLLFRFTFDTGEEQGAPSDLVLP